MTTGAALASSTDILCAKRHGIATVYGTEHGLLLALRG
jgi:hypothetical protein